jgi:type I restriction enzyme S subunit
MKSNYEPLGKHIQFVDYRNSEEVTSTVLGISIDKEFMPSVANVIGTDLSRYKLISKGLFACNPMHVGRDERLPIALYEKDNAAIVSPAYFMFEIIDRDVLNEEYLMMWFRRPEFDRECWFMTDGSVRGGITWDDLCRIKLPVPSYARQCEIVESYRAITDRIALKRAENDNLEATAMSLYKSWFIDYEPFDLDDEGLPVGWCKEKLNDKLSTSTQSINPQKMDCDFVWHYSIPAYDNEKLPSKDTPSSILSNKYIVPQNAILVSKLNPDTKRIWRSVPCFENAICSTEFIVFSTKEPTHRAFYYLLFNTGSFIDFLVSNATGSTNSRMRVKPASSLDFEFICPPNEVIDSFCRKVEPLLQKIEENHLEIRKLKELIPIAVAKMMSSSR